MKNLILIAALALFSFTSCNQKNKSETNETNMMENDSATMNNNGTTMEKDSMMMNNDSTMIDNTSRR